MSLPMFEKAVCAIFGHKWSKWKIGPGGFDYQILTRICTRCGLGDGCNIVGNETVDKDGQAFDGNMSDGVDYVDQNGTPLIVEELEEEESNYYKVERKI